MPAPIAGVVPADKRIERWDHKLDGDALSTIVGRLKADMKLRAVTTFEWIVEYENATKLLLDGQGIQSIFYPGYLNFSRELARLSSKFSGVSLTANAAPLRTKWLARGLTQAVLEDIQVMVWNIPLT